MQLRSLLVLPILLATNAPAQSVRESASHDAARWTLTPSLAWQRDGSAEALDLGAHVTLRLDVVPAGRFRFGPEVMIGSFISRSDLCITSGGCGPPGTTGLAAALVHVRYSAGRGHDTSLGAHLGHYRAFGGRGRDDSGAGGGVSLSRSLVRDRSSPALSIAYHHLFGRVQTTHAFVLLGVAFRF